MLVRTRPQPVLGCLRAPLAAAVAIAALGLTIARSSSAQSGSSPAAPLPALPAGSPSPGAGAPQPPGTPQPPPGYQQPTPGYQQPPPGYAQPAPGYQQPPSGYQQPPSGYAQPAPGYSQPAPGYSQPAAPPAGAPGYAQPSYGYAPPPLPPPPKRTELQWSIRFNLFDLLFGRATGELEYAFAGPFSITIAPQYIFGDRRADRNSNVTATGSGIYGELGLWVEGRPLRGYFLKAHAGHAWVKFHGDNDAEVDVPETKLGLMFGSQSIYGGWFTLSGGFGVAIDTQSEDRDIPARDSKTNMPFTYTVPAAGLFGNGWDLLSQIGIGGSF